MDSRSSDTSPVAALVFGGLFVLVGLGLVGSAGDLQRQRDAGEPPLFPEWFYWGWYERRPHLVAMTGYGLAAVGCLLVVLGILRLTVL
jgi:hypothetical protein